MTAATAMTSEVTIVPANEASWKDLEAVFGTRGGPSSCLCQRFKPAAGSGTPRRHRLLSRSTPPGCARQTRCGHPEADTTSGLVAYLDGEPAGWCAVEPRSAHVRLGRTPGRAERRTRPTAASGP